MNVCLLKEVEAERDVVTQLKAAAKDATDQHGRDNEAAEKREEWMGQMCNAMKAAERAKAAEQESRDAKEREWVKEKANLLEAYEKCRQGLERAVRKLKEEKEKQTAMEERWRAAQGKRKLKGRFPATSDSGGESTRGPTPVEVEETNPEPTRRRTATSGPGRGEWPLREAAGPERRDLGAEPRW